MACAFDVSPYDGGWCVKIGDTGEVLFFSGRRRAVVEAHDMARAWPGAVEVRIHGRSVLARSFGRDAGDDATAAFPYPLGAPA